MVTTRRSSEFNVSKGGIELLERPATYEEFTTSTPSVEEDYSSAKERMQRNLDKLLNYDRASEMKDTVEQPVVEAVLASDEDIRPTSTTMQFGDDIDQIRKEMNVAKEQEKKVFRLNNKGKFVMVLYALAVTIMLALIVLNTNMLANLNTMSKEKSAELVDTQARYSAIQDNIDSISSNEYVIDIVENQYGMVKK